MSINPIPPRFITIRKAFSADTWSNDEKTWTVKLSHADSAYNIRRMRVVHYGFVTPHLDSSVPVFPLCEFSVQGIQCGSVNDGVTESSYTFGFPLMVESGTYSTSRPGDTEAYDVLCNAEEGTLSLKDGVSVTLRGLRRVGVVPSSALCREFFITLLVYPTGATEQRRAIAVQHVTEGHSAASVDPDIYRARANVREQTGYNAWAHSIGLGF